MTWLVSLGYNVFFGAVALVFIFAIVWCICVSVGWLITEVRDWLWPNHYSKGYQQTPPTQKTKNPRAE